MPHVLVSSFINEQHQSRLLLIPPEIRHSIYTFILPPEIHVSVNKYRLRFTPCVKTKSSFIDGSECKPSSADEWSAKEAWARRLRSNWGPHWECEELATPSNNIFSGSSTILLVCKQLACDVLEFVASQTRFHVTEPTVLDCWAWNSSARNPSPDAPLVISSLFAMPQIGQLSIAWRFPWGSCKARERLGVEADTEARFHHSHESFKWAAWVRLPENIKRFHNLRKIHLWLDHNEECPWATINERVLLSPLLPLAQKGLDIAVDLPDLDPLLTDSGWHYLPTEPVPEFTLHRRPRQKHHGVPRASSGGSFYVASEPYVPLLLEILGIGDMSMEEAWKYELEYWRRGINFRSYMLREMDEIHAFD